MLDKDSSEYNSYRIKLGIVDSCRPNIPKTIKKLSDDELKMLKYVVVKTWKLYKMTDAVTQQICRMCPPRIPISMDSIDDDFGEYGAFFITSVIPLDKDSIKSHNNLVVRVYGGECLQSIKHYHYLFIFEFCTSRKKLEFNIKCNCCGVATSTDYCIQYIKSQLISKAYEFNLPGYESCCWANNDKFKKMKTRIPTKQYNLKPDFITSNQPNACTESIGDEMDYDGEYNLLVLCKPEEDNDEFRSKLSNNPKYNRVRCFIINTIL